MAYGVCNSETLMGTRFSRGKVFASHLIAINRGVRNEIDFTVSHGKPPSNFHCRTSNYVHIVVFGINCENPFFCQPPDPSILSHFHAIVDWLGKRKFLCDYLPIFWIKDEKHITRDTINLVI